MEYTRALYARAFALENIARKLMTERQVTAAAFAALRLSLNQRKIGDAIEALDEICAAGESLAPADIPHLGPLPELFGVTHG